MSLPWQGCLSTAANDVTPSTRGSCSFGRKAGYLAAGAPTATTLSFAVPPGNVAYQNTHFSDSDLQEDPHATPH